MKRVLFLLLLSIFIPSVCYGAAATQYATPAGAGNKDGTDWDNAYSVTELGANINGGEAGDIFYIYTGTYSLVQIAANGDGTAASPIQVIGVSDQEATPAEAMGNDRPLIALGASYWYCDDQWQLRNMRFESTNAVGIRNDLAGIFYNCHALNDSATVDLPAFNPGGAPGKGVIISSAAKSTNGYAIKLATASESWFCYTYDSSVGIYHSTSYNSSYGNIADGCTTGISVAAISGGRILNNTIYDCTTGINFADQQQHVAVNNILKDCTTGISSAAAGDGGIWIDYNCYDGNTADVTNLTKGIHAVTDDPLLTAPDSDDFTLGSGSPCLDAGAQPMGALLVGDYMINIGADQDDVAAGGGGGAWGHF